MKKFQKSTFSRITALAWLCLLLLLFSCKKNTDVEIVEKAAPNYFQPDDKLRSLSEIGNGQLEKQLPRTIAIVKDILLTKVSSNILANKNLSIDTSHIYVLAGDGMRNTYLFNLIPSANNTGEAFTAQIVSLKIQEDARGSFLHQLFIYRDNTVPEKVIHFDSEGVQQNNGTEATAIQNTTNQSAVPDANIMMYPGSVFPLELSTYPWPTSTAAMRYTPKPPNVFKAAPKSVLLQFAISTNNWALAANLGYIIPVIGGPCNISYCQQFYNGTTVPSTANLTVANLSIPNINPIHPNPWTQTYTPFNNVVFAPTTFTNLKSLIQTYYQTVFVIQGNFFTQSSLVTDAEHIKKETFIHNFFYWLYNLSYQNNPLFAYLRDNANAMSKLFDFFTEINLWGSDLVYINSPYANNSTDYNAKYLNKAAAEIAANMNVLQQYVNNQITKQQFVDYYRAMLDFEPGLSTAQFAWRNANRLNYDQILLNIGQDYPAKKSNGYWAIQYRINNPSIPFSTFLKQFLQNTEGRDLTHDAAYWDNPALTFPAQNLPSWSAFEAAYPKRSDPLYNTPQKLCALIGGLVVTIHNSAQFNNTAALRVSRALNYSGVTIPPGPDRFAGSDGKVYFVNNASLYKWMRKTFTSATVPASDLIFPPGHVGGTFGQNFPNILAGRKGIYSMMPISPGVCTNGTTFCASAHVDIMNNAIADGHAYFDAFGGINEIRFWVLQ
jgi:hypothetical protein